MEFIKECPICETKKQENFLVCRDYLVTQDNFQMVQCTNCEFIFTNPRPLEDSIQDYYLSENYFSHKKKSTSLVSSIYNLVRTINVNNKLKLIANYNSSATSLLDYGCGAGFFLGAARDKSFQVKGVEPNFDARSIASNSGMDVCSPEELMNLQDNSFEVITLWHVLEHIHKLNASFDLLKSKLTSDGIMVIALPNMKSWDAKKYGVNWAAYDLPRHLYHFSKDSFSKFAEKHGMNIVGIHPMKFDAFYVSLLSEAETILKYPKAFVNGMRSNFSARKSMNYSSLIYILKKA